MASALMELMRPEVEKYAQEYARKHVQEYAQKYADEEKIKLMVKGYMSGALSENIAVEMVDLTREQFLKYVEQYREKE